MHQTVTFIKFAFKFGLSNFYHFARLHHTVSQKETKIILYLTLTNSNPQF